MAKQHSCWRSSAYFSLLIRNVCVLCMRVNAMENTVCHRNRYLIYCCCCCCCCISKEWIPDYSCINWMANAIDHFSSSTTASNHFVIVASTHQLAVDVYVHTRTIVNWPQIPYYHLTASYSTNKRIAVWKCEEEPWHCRRVNRNKFNFWIARRVQNVTKTFELKYSRGLLSTLNAERIHILLVSSIFIAPSSSLFVTRSAYKSITIHNITLFSFDWPERNFQFVSRHSLFPSYIHDGHGETGGTGRWAEV